MNIPMDSNNPEGQTVIDNFRLQMEEVFAAKKQKNNKPVVEQNE
jgi:hypothetical protein